MLCTYGSQTMWKKSKSQPENHRFFHETHLRFLKWQKPPVLWFWKILKEPEPAIIWIWNTERKRTGGSLKFKEPYNTAIFISSHLVVDSSIVKQWTIWEGFGVCRFKAQIFSIISVCLCSQISGATNKFAVCLFSALHISANGKGSTLNLALQKLNVWSPDSKYIELHPISFYFGVGEFLKSVEHATQT